MSTTKKEIKWYEKLEQSKREDTTETKSSQETSKNSKRKKPMVHLEKYVQGAGQWLDDIAEEMNLEERPDIALQALRGVLHAMRDRMVPEEVFNLSAQLPVLVRGFYFEGYNLNAKPEKYGVKKFLEIIEMSFAGNDAIKPRLAFKAVLNKLYENVSKGEMEDIYDGMPKDIKKLWKENLSHK